MLSQIGNELILVGLTQAVFVLRLTACVLDVTVDGADEVDPDLNLIKGYGRAMVREKIVAASSRSLVILVGEEKLVPRLGTRRKLPVDPMRKLQIELNRAVKDERYEEAARLRDEIEKQKPV